MNTLLWLLWTAAWITAIVLMAKHWEASDGLKGLVGFVIAVVGWYGNYSIANAEKDRNPY